MSGLAPPESPLKALLDKRGRSKPKTLVELLVEGAIAEGQRKAREAKLAEADHREIDQSQKAVRERLEDDHWRNH